MQVAILKYPKVHGTRFQSHKERGLKALLYNYCVFLMFSENTTETRGIVTAPMQVKLQGFYKKMLSLEFLGSISLYERVLELTSRLGLTMESDSLLITDIYDSLHN